MKRVVCVFALVVLAAVPLFALKTTLVDDVIRMTASGVAEETILDYVQGSRDQFTVTADDILAMGKAGVSQKVIKAIITKEGPPQTTESQPAPSQPAATSPEPASQTATSDNGGCISFEPPASLWWPYLGTVVPPQLWDPFWYQPTYDVKSGVPAAAGRTRFAPTHESPVLRDDMPAVADAHEPSDSGRVPVTSGRAPSSSGRAPATSGRSESAGRPSARHIETTSSRGFSARSR